MSDRYDASSIQVLEGLEAVRKRPAMYIGSTTVKGLNHLIYEILDNSIDEASNGYGDTIYVTLNSDGSCTIEDSGRGIPVDLHDKGVSAERVILTTLHAGGKFSNTNYKISGGLHGVGSSVVNALSDQFKVTIKRNGNVYEDTYSKGLPTTELVDGLLPVVGTCPKKLTGTTITFKPDYSIFDTDKFKVSDIEQRLHELAYLNPNLSIVYKNELPYRKENEIESATFHEPNGLASYLNNSNSSEPITDLFEYSGEFEGRDGTIIANVAMQYVNSSQERISGFVNNIPTPEGGTHLTGFKSALTSTINNYARELGILKDKDANFLGTDVRTGLHAVISIKHPDPTFEGQTKTKIDNIDAKQSVESITNEQIQIFFDRSIEDLKKVLSLAEKSAKFRSITAKNKENLFTPKKKKFSFDSNGKLSDCTGKDPKKRELFIVEGDSAAGSSKMARDRTFQAILPIRGKILNTEKADISKILANAEIKTLIYALGCGFSEGFGDDFDISKLNYDKVVILADSDQDGNHIITLIITLFYNLLPELITAGHLYVACPPLYKAIVKNGEDTYLQDERELEEFSKTHKNFHLQRFKGLGEMDPDQLWETTLDPTRRTLKRVCIEDVSKASEITTLLMGNDVPNRKKFIYSNADSAILDV